MSRSIAAHMIVAALLLCGACGVNARRTENGNKTVDAAMENQETNGMELILTFSEQVQLTATVKNGTKEPVRLLMNTNIMPCRLALVDEGGQEIVPNDQREKMKYPPNPEPHEYVTIEPGDRVTVQTSRFKARSDGAFDLRWAPFLYYGLAPERYTATATIVSDETAASGVPGAWRGMLVSESISFTLSAPR